MMSNNQNLSKIAMEHTKWRWTRKKIMEFHFSLHMLFVWTISPLSYLPFCVCQPKYDAIKLNVYLQLLYLYVCVCVIRVQNGWVCGIPAKYGQFKLCILLLIRNLVCDWHNVHVQLLCATQRIIKIQFTIDCILFRLPLCTNKTYTRVCVCLCWSVNYKFCVKFI